MKVKILGYGEIGQAVTKFIERHVGIDLAIEDPAYKLFPPQKAKFDYVLVCIPYSDNFVQIVMKELKVTNHIIIFSTVPIGTTEQIQKAVHIPIEGKHPDLLESLDNWEFFMGYNDTLTLYDYIEFFSDIGKIVTPVKGTRTTEACKLLSTLIYGVNIEFYRFAENLLKKNNADGKVFQYYNRAYNQLYEHLGHTGIKRYILEYPEGEIGGHCVVPNAKFIDGIFPDIVKNTYKGAKI